MKRTAAANDYSTPYGKGVGPGNSGRRPWEKLEQHTFLVRWFGEGIGKAQQVEATGQDEACFEFCKRNGETQGIRFVVVGYRGRPREVDMDAKCVRLPAFNGE